MYSVFANEVVDSCKGFLEGVCPELTNQNSNEIMQDCVFPRHRNLANEAVWSRYKHWELMVSQRLRQGWMCSVFFPFLKCWSHQNLIAAIINSNPLLIHCIIRIGNIQSRKDNFRIRDEVECFYVSLSNRIDPLNDQKVYWQWCSLVYYF